MRLFARRYLLTLLALVPALSADLALAWPPGGVPVAPLPGGGQAEPHLLLGRDGAVLSYWSDARWHDGYYDLYGQLLDRLGNVAPGWPDTGLMIVRAADDQRPAAGLSRPDGSFIVGVIDARLSVDGGTASDYLTRVLPTGAIDPAWPRHGFPATDTVGAGFPYRMIWVAPDTLVTAGLYDYPDGVLRTIFQKVAVTPAGPMSLWSTGGIVHQWRPKPILSTLEIVPDDVGGLFEVFDERLVPDSDGDLYMVRLGRDGQLAPGWESGARPISIAPGPQEVGVACADGAGGLYVAWADARDGAGLGYPAYLQYEDIRLLRLTSEATPYPGWPADGLLVSNALGQQFLPYILLDGTGGVYVSWEDHSGIRIGLTRVQGDGTFAPGWARNGIQVTDLFAYTSESKLVLDGADGVFVLFVDEGQLDNYLQHVLARGARDPAWPSAGLLVSVVQGADIVSDAAGGCYVAYRKQVVPLQPMTSVYVARFSVDGPVAVHLAEATVDVEPGRVRLLWHGAEAAAAETRVERRSKGSDAWQAIGTPTARGRDELEYEDLAVAAGASYDYRLVRGAEVLSQEVSVTLPAAAFALAGAQPNPALARELSVAFTLAGAAPARLEVLDLAGRREYARALIGLSPGRHVMPLAEARLAPGLHWLKLSEGAHTAHERVVVMQ